MMASNRAESPASNGSSPSKEGLGKLEPFLKTAGQRLADAAVELSYVLFGNLDHKEGTGPAVDRARLPGQLAGVCCELLYRMSRRSLPEKAVAVRRVLLDSASSQLYFRLFPPDEGDRPGALEYFRMLFFQEAESISEDGDLSALLDSGESSLISSLEGAGEGAGPGAVVDFFVRLIGDLLSDSVPDSVQGLDEGDPGLSSRSRGDVRRFIEDSGLMEAAARLF